VTDSGSRAGHSSKPTAPSTAPSPAPPPADRRHALGRSGEDLAAQWYTDHGYEILERNWRRREGEVDLIVRRARTVAFCEVKTRSSDRFGTGAEAVVAPKQRRIRRLAARWLSELTPASGRARVEVRFDVVSITGEVVDVIEDAF
jgi:putative endonuclease